MNQNPNKVQQYEDEIDLRELIMALWKQKTMIISITLIAAILAGIISMFIISPVYDTNLNIVISMPEKYMTRYGEYTLPITSNDQYINLIYSNDVLVNTIADMGYNASDVTVEKLKKRISIEKIDTVKVDYTQNAFNVKVSADNSADSLKLAETLYKNYIKFMDVMTKERAVSFYYENFNVNLKTMEVQLKSNKELLKKNEELLSQIPQSLKQLGSNIEIKSELTEKSDYVIPVDTVNPIYLKIENDIIVNKQNINTIEDTIRVDKEHLVDLDKERTVLAKYYETGRIAPLESSVIGVVETSVYLSSPPVAPNQKTSPSNAMNVAIGIVIGGMIGVMVALAKEYWFKKA